MRKKISVLIGSVAIAAALVYLLTPRDRPLIPRSVRVALTAPWMFSHMPGSRICRYGWLSDHEVLHTKSTSPLSGMGLSRLNLNSGTDSPAANLESMLRLPKNSMAHSSVWAWNLAPQGRSLMWYGTGDTHICWRAGIDDTHAGGWKVPRTEGSLSAYWLHSDRWMGLRWRLDAGLKSLNPTMEAWVYSMDSDKPVLIAPVSPEVSHAAAKMGASVRAASGKLYTLIEARRGNERLPFLAVESIPNQQGDPAKYPIAFPEGWRYYTHSVAPSGKRIVWFLMIGSQLRTSAAMARIFPWLQGSVPARAGLWLSDSDGSNFREIGHIYEQPKGVFDIEQIQWVPGEKRISFLHKEALYTVAVD